MTIRSWVPRDFAGSAAVCVLLALPIAKAHANPATPHHPAAHAASKPHASASAHAPATKHLTVAHQVARHTAAPPVAVQTRGQSASKSKAEGSSHSKSAAKHAAPAPASKSRPAAKSNGKPARGKQKHRAEEEADGDPLVIYRAEAHGKRPLHGAAQHTAIARDVTVNRSSPAESRRTLKAEARPEPPVSDEVQPEESGLAGVKGTHDRHSLKSLKSAQPVPAARSTMPPAGFMRVPGPGTADTTARSTQPTTAKQAVVQQDPYTDADPLLDPRQPVVSAATQPATPAGKATLPEKLRSIAVKAETAAKSDAAALRAGAVRQGPKPSFLPEDPAEKDAVIEEAMVPRVLPNLYNHGGRLVIPPPMKGNHDILVHQNLMADKDGLDRIQNDADLNRMRSSRLLVDLYSTTALEVNPQLPENRRAARPWTAKFVQDVSRSYYEQFRQPLHLSSAVRTVSYQLRLQRVNGNAAAVDGDGASPHLTGQAIDFGKHGMSITEIAWMRAYLAPLMDSGKIDVEEEFQQACFHISVYKSYMPVTRKPRMMTVAQVAAAPIVRAEAKNDEPEQEVQ